MTVAAGVTLLSHAIDLRGFTGVFIFVRLYRTQFGQNLISSTLTFYLVLLTLITSLFSIRL